MKTEPRHHYRKTWAEIDLGKIRRNFSRFVQLFQPQTFICPMIKADAYGHGATEVAKALRLEGATHLGVSLLEEGLRLREAGDTRDILTFGSFEGHESANAILAANLTPVVSQWQELESLTGLDFHPARKTKIHLKFNTGMNRLGFTPADAPKLRDWIDHHPAFELEGIATHLQRGDDAGNPEGDSAAQLKSFTLVLRAFQGIQFQSHVYNSSASVNLAALRAKKSAQEDHAHGARPGIGIYGITPTNDANSDIGLEPAMRWISHLVDVRSVPVDETVSYGATWKAKRASVIGVVPAGYADGVYRILSNRGSVLCRGQRAPIVGIVCMDLFMVDLTDIVTKTGAVVRGEEIIMIGEQAGQEDRSGAKGTIHASEIADLAHTIPYEVLTRVSQRVPRIYRGFI